MQNGDKAVDAVDVEATWQRLASRPGSQLIDVRTRAEWAYVGIPDLGPISKRAVLVEWQTFPDQTADPRFAERLAGELKGAWRAAGDRALLAVDNSVVRVATRWRPKAKRREQPGMAGAPTG
jgi:rhodanese-related sulfurtransferase